MNRKKSSKGSIVIWVIILLVIMIYNIAGDRDLDDVLPALLVAAVTIVVVVDILVFKKRKTAKPGNQTKTAVELHRPFPQPTAAKTKPASPVFRHKDEAEAEEAITCAHHTGKQKYLEQIEGFYKNGLIDRAEYKTLREKYEKLDLPEDYH